MKALLLSFLLAACLVGCELRTSGQPPRTSEQPPERYRLIVTSQRWSNNSPVVYKIDTATGQTWVNAVRPLEEAWCEIPVISAADLERITRAKANQ